MDKAISAVQKVIYGCPTNAKLGDQDVKLLNSFSKERVVPLLREIFITEKDIVAKSKAYDALLVIKNYDVVQFLLDVFDQSSIDWQIVYCTTFSHYPEPRAITRLCRVLLEHPDPDVRYTAAESLGSIGDESAIVSLERACKYDEGVDFEGFTIAKIAHTAIVKIKNRISQ